MSSKHSRLDVRSLGYTLGMAMVGVVLAGCATDALRHAPSAPNQAWKASQSAGPGSYTLAEDPRMAALSQRPLIDQESAYTLSALIDIAQQENPSTELAWNRAKQAALAIGVTEASFLPMISANVVGGWQKVSTPSPITLGGLPRDLQSEVSGVAPFLALEWLLFDFGQRHALLKGAERASYAANVLFNGTHQKIIHDVTHAFYAYGAARAQLRIVNQALDNNRKVLEAVEQRVKGGVATTIELALVRQRLAQTMLRAVNAEGLQRSLYLGLLAAVGISPKSRIQVAELPHSELPQTAPALTEEAIEQAMSRRPDLQASYAALNLAEANVEAAKAAFMPKVYLAAIAGRNRSSFDMANLPSLSHRSTTSAALIGISVPLYDAGLRSTRLADAEIHVDSAGKIFEKVQQDAVREVVAAHDILRSALASYYAAGELEKAAAVAYDAAFDAYQHGLGTITAVTETSTLLLDAQGARSEAYFASLSSAANLAFVMGAMAMPKQDIVMGVPRQALEPAN